VVVVGCRAYNGALLGVCQSKSYKGEQYSRLFEVGIHTFWPSFEKSTSGWFGGRTSVVVPMTGQDMMAVVVCVVEKVLWEFVSVVEPVGRSGEVERSKQRGR
jgi:hypothetical protein